MPKYRFAFNLTETVMDVVDLVKGDPEARGPFRCAGCGDPVIPRLKDDQRVKHFAHKVRQVSCSKETYLHRIAKRTFVEVYQACLDSNEPFIVVLNHPKTCERFKEILGVRCRVGEYAKTHDLTGFFDGIREEKRDGQFVPDVLLFNRRDESQKIYVEVAVTHFLSDAKISSGHRIIEISVETEADIDKIKACSLTEREARFVGFPRPAAQATDAECHCARRDFLCFLIFESGKAFLDRAPLSEITTRRKKFGDKVRYVRLLTDSPSPTEVLRLMDGGLNEDDEERRGKDSPNIPPDAAHSAFTMNANQTEAQAVGGLGSYGHPYRPYAGHEPGFLFVALIEEAKRRGYPVRNCYLCRYKGENWGWNAETGIFCKIFKRICNSNNAVGCSYFLPPKASDTPPACSQRSLSTASSTTKDQEKQAASKMRQDKLRQETLEKERRETEERLRTLGARRDALRVAAMFGRKDSSADLPDGCLYRTEKVELWREPDGDYALFTKEGVLERFDSAHAAFTYLSARELLD